MEMINVIVSYTLNSLIIKMEYKDNNILLHKYYFEKTIDELQKYNNFLISFENTKEIFQEICYFIEKSSIVVEKNKILLTILIYKK